MNDNDAVLLGTGLIFFGVLYLVGYWIEFSYYWVE